MTRTPDQASATPALIDVDTCAGVAEGGSASSSGMVCSGAASPGPTNVCGTSPGKVAWTKSIAGTPITDTAAGRSDDVVVATASKATRLDATGAQISTTFGVQGAPFDSGIVLDSHGNIAYGAFSATPTALPPKPASYACATSFSLTDRCGGTVASDFYPQTVMGASGPIYPPAGIYGIGADDAGNVSFLLMAYTYPFYPGPIQRAIYDFSSKSGFLGTTQIPDVPDSTPSLTHVFRKAGGDLLVTQVVYTNGAGIDIGCGQPALLDGGGPFFAERTPSGNCVWQTVLAAPGASLSSWMFAPGDDGSVAFAAAFTNTIDLGDGPLTNPGTSSLGITRYDDAGHYVWSKSFGGAGSSFKVGTLHVNAAGTLLVSGTYSGTVDFGGGPLPAGNDTFVAAFDACGALRWVKTVTVGSSAHLFAAAGSCGAFIATDSTTADLGTGALATSTNYGVAALGL